MARGKPKTLLEVFTGGNYGLDPAPMIWVDAASSRKSQPILACPHCQYLHEWLPASWLCTRCNGRVTPPPPAGGSSDPDGALCAECGGWVAGEDDGACVCDDKLTGGQS